MANPVCLSPLKFYDDIAKQCHRKSYAYKHISPLYTKLNYIPPFQFVIPTYLYNNGGNGFRIVLCNALTDESVVSMPSTYQYIQDNVSINSTDGYVIFSHFGKSKFVTEISEGLYYLKVQSGNGGLWTYYSEVFCFTQITQNLLEIEYWNETGNFGIKNGIISFDNDFHFKVLLQSELGKPEYSFEEESTKRLGYNYIESQVSKKIYKFNTVAPEFICDAMRIIRLCDNKVIRSYDDEYSAISFEMEVEWQTQGDLASINCEFETDNVIANLGGFIPDKLGGDYNEDYDNSFNKE